MNKIAAIVVVGFILAFAAGGSVGMLAGPEPPAGPRPDCGGPRLSRELNLTPEQHEQMREIWSKVGPGPGGRGPGREWELWQQRQEAMDSFLAELTDERRQRYDEIQDDFRRGMEELMRERFRLVQEAVERTRKVLTPEQAKIYEEMRRHGRRRMHGPGGPPAGQHRPGRPGGPGPYRGGRKSLGGRGGPFRMPLGPDRYGERRGPRDPRGPRHTQPTTQP